jgi:hypothetical protein
MGYYKLLSVTVGYRKVTGAAQMNIQYLLPFQMGFARVSLESLPLNFVFAFFHRANSRSERNER